MTRTTHSNEYERKLLENVAKHGWQCTSVASDDDEDDSPPFSYTIGLFHSYGVPEFIMFGLPQGTAHAILSTIAGAAAAGRPIPLDVPCADLIDDYECVFLKIPRASYDEYVLSALWFQDGEDFPLYQVVWPSKSGQYPWHPEATESFKQWQPVLGHAG